MLTMKMDILFACVWLRTSSGPLPALPVHLTHPVRRVRQSGTHPSLDLLEFVDVANAHANIRSIVGAQGNLSEKHPEPPVLMSRPESGKCNGSYPSHTVG
jgi:hypothetical protein